MSRAKPIYKGKIDGKSFSVFIRVTKDMDPGDAGICHKRGNKFFISVRPDLPARKTLEVIIHEFLHAADWQKDEEWVQDTGRSLALLLYAVGYRSEDV